MIFTWLFAGAWCLVSFPMAPMAWVEAGALVGLLFPGVGIGLLWYAQRTSRQWRRYGVTRLTLDPYPGSIGGHVGGCIELGAAASARRHYEVTLECIRSYLSGSRDNRSRSYDVEWQASGPARLAGGQRGGLRLEFRFDVPAGLPESEKPQSSYHFWRVRVESDQPDVPLERTFEIAVFATAQTSAHIEADTTAAGREAAAGKVAGALDDPRKAAQLRDAVGLSIEQRGDWLRLMFHTGRQKLLATILIGMGLVFGGVGLFAADAEPMMRWIFTLIGLLGLGWGLYLPFNTLDVRISTREIKRVRALFGLVIQRQSIRPEQLRELTIVKGATTYVNDRTTVFYRLVGKGSFGRFRLADGLPDRELVEAIREKVMTCAGLMRT